MRWFERKRIEFIQLHLQTVGHLNRATLTNQFQISIPQASHDIATYKAVRKRWMAPKITYNAKMKRYEAEWFTKRQKEFAP